MNQWENVRGLNTSDANCKYASSIFVNKNNKFGVKKLFTLDRLINVQYFYSIAFNLQDKITDCRFTNKLEILF